MVRSKSLVLRGKLSRAALAACVLGASVGVVALALAEPSPEAVAAARQAFSEGEKAFAAHDYPRAGAAFEAAYRAAPHPDALWNAARAWHQAAGEGARAANLYARYLRDAAPDAADRDAATAALKELSTKLARLDVVAAGVDAITIDGAPLEGGSLYVNPGTHVARAKSRERELVKTVEALAGSVTSVALVGEPSPPPTTSASAPPPPAPLPTTSASAPPIARRPLSPWVTIAGSGLTAIAGGFLIGSSVDTLNGVADYHAKRIPNTAENQTAMLAKEHRTNVLVAVTAGLGGLTALATIFFVDFHDRPVRRVEASPGLGSLVVRGSF